MSSHLGRLGQEQVRQEVALGRQVPQVPQEVVLGKAGAAGAAGAADAAGRTWARAAVRFSSSATRLSSSAILCQRRYDEVVLGAIIAPEAIELGARAATAALGGGSGADSGAVCCRIAALLPRRMNPAVTKCIAGQRGSAGAEPKHCWSAG